MQMGKQYLELLTDKNYNNEKKQRKDYSVYLRKSGIKAKDGKLAYISQETITAFP